MITPVLFALLFVGISVWASRDSYSDGDRIMAVFGWVIWMIGLGMCVGLGFVVSAGIGAMLPEAIAATPSHSARLVSLRGVDSMSGSISGGLFVVRGEFGSETYYRYYEQSGDAVTPRQVVAGQGVYIHEGDVAPKVDVFDWHFKRDWWRWFAIEPTGKTYRLYVPKGSVVSSFQIQP